MFWTAALNWSAAIGGRMSKCPPPGYDQLVSIAMNESKPDEYLTVAEIAGELKLNQQTVRNMIDRGQVRAVRVGARRVRVLRSDLDRFLAGGATAPPLPPIARATSRPP